MYDFPDKELGKAVPRASTTWAATPGWVSVGADRDASAFAMQIPRRRWNTIGDAG